MAGVLTRLRSILIKRQAVLGAPETLNAANGIGDFSDMAFQKPDLKRIDTDNLAEQSFGHTKARYDDGASVLPGNVTVPIYRPSAPGSVPGNQVAEILAGLCGLSEAINAGVSVVYGPQTPTDLISAPRATIDIVEGSDAYVLTDARGSAVISGAPGQDLTIKPEFKAPFAAPTPSATPVAVTVPAGDPFRFAGAVAMLKDAVAINIGAFDFDIGGEVVENINSSGVNVLVKNRKPILKIPTNAVVGATNIAAIRAATSFTLQATWTGLVIDITARLADMDPEDQDGNYGNIETFEVLTYSLTFS